MEPAPHLPVDESTPQPAVAAIAQADADDAWYDTVAIHPAPGADAGGPSARSAIGTASLPARAPRGPGAPRRSRSADTVAAPGQTAVRVPGRSRARPVVLGVLLALVVIVIAVVANPPGHATPPRSTDALKPSPHPTTPTSAAASAPAHQNHQATSSVPPAAAAEPPAARPARRRHHRRRLAAANSTPSTLLPPPSPAVAPAATPALAPVPAAPAQPAIAAAPRYRAPQPHQSFDPSYTPGDLPPASNTR